MVDASRDVDFFEECLPLFPPVDPEAPLVLLPMLFSLLVLKILLFPLWLLELPV